MEKDIFITEAEAKKLVPEGYEIECVDNAYEKALEEGCLSLEEFMDELNKSVENI